MTAPVPALAGRQYQQLDSERIVATLQRLRDRIAERFPGSGLSRVATDLLGLSDDVSAFVLEVQRPNWALRSASGVAIAAMAVVVVFIIRSLTRAESVSGVADFIQAIDATISTLVFLGATIFFLTSLENRMKRRRALALLHQLRSVAHIVDMHQLTKDPERILTAHPDTASSPERTLTAPELGRYLDYCSELLSVISKLAALQVQHFNDPVALAAVNDVESLTAALSGKMWQKITLLERRS